MKQARIALNRIEKSVYYTSKDYFYKVSVWLNRWVYISL